MYGYVHEGYNCLKSRFSSKCFLHKDVQKRQDNTIVTKTGPFTSGYLQRECSVLNIMVVEQNVKSL